MEGQPNEESMQTRIEATIIEWYGNGERPNKDSLVVGFTEDKTAYMSRKILDSSGDWTAWEPIGSAADYVDNAQFAELNGCRFKLDNAPVRSESETGPDS